ncbi:hypothetical protein [Puerhibacterium sp. TATVAM-FAB25]|uniref:hypothetical protein n=1 Tax=Puerhibacterium sp. TATVAM-FAB25 TaxID=3093699 RepID=UPI00397B4FF6
MAEVVGDTGWAVIAGRDGHRERGTDGGAMRTVSVGTSHDAWRGHAPVVVPSRPRWIVLCAAAETVGMTAAAAAARGGAAMTQGDATGADLLGAWAVVVGGGLVEGLALGLAQAWGLRVWLPRRRRLRWMMVTLVVAGVGWAAGSAPAILAGAGGTPPPAWTVAGGAVGVGVAMGALLGVAQAWVLRGVVPRPGLWVGACTAGWAVAMPVIFLGASTTGVAWSIPAVVGWGAATGAAAGAVLGAVTGLLLPAVASAPGRTTDPPERTAEPSPSTAPHPGRPGT